MDRKGQDRKGAEWTGKDRIGSEWHGGDDKSPFLLKDIMTISKKSEEDEDREFFDKLTKKFVRSNRKGTLIKACLHILISSIHVSNVLQRMMIEDKNLLRESTLKDVYIISYLEYMRIKFIQNLDKEEELQEDLEENYQIEEKFDEEDFKGKFLSMLDLLNKIAKNIK